MRLDNLDRIHIAEYLEPELSQKTQRNLKFIKLIGLDK